MSRRAACLLTCGLVAASVAACGHAKPSVTLPVDPPGDDSCIGVAGFIVTVKPVGKAPIAQILPNRSPVLSRDACRLPYAALADDIDLDAPIDVTIEGYDSIEQQRVTGTARIPSLDAPGNQRLQLAAATQAGSMSVIVIDRTMALAGRSLAEVTQFEVTTKTNGPVIGPVQINEATPFFAVGEPGAFALSADPTGEIIVILTFGTDSSGKPHYSVAQTPGEPFLRATPL